MFFFSFLNRSLAGKKRFLSKIPDLSLSDQREDKDKIKSNAEGFSGPLINKKARKTSSLQMFSSGKTRNELIPDHSTGLPKRLNSHYTVGSYEHAKKTDSNSIATNNDTCLEKASSKETEFGMNHFVTEQSVLKDPSSESGELTNVDSDVILVEPSMLKLTEARNPNHNEPFGVKETNARGGDQDIKSTTKQCIGDFAFSGDKDVFSFGGPDPFDFKSFGEIPF